MGGIFDDADHDDVVLLVMAITGVVNSRPVLAAPTRRLSLPFFRSYRRAPTAGSFSDGANDSHPTWRAIPW